MENSRAPLACLRRSLSFTLMPGDRFLLGHGKIGGVLRAQLLPGDLQGFLLEWQTSTDLVTLMTGEHLAKEHQRAHRTGIRCQAPDPP